jgi:hypothetical protein
MRPLAENPSHTVVPTHTHTVVRTHTHTHQVDVGRYMFMDLTLMMRRFKPFAEARVRTRACTGA